MHGNLALQTENLIAVSTLVSEGGMRSAAACRGAVAATQPRCSY